MNSGRETRGVAQSTVGSRQHRARATRGVLLDEGGTEPVEISKGVDFTWARALHTAPIRYCPCAVCPAVELVVVSGPDRGPVARRAAETGSRA